MDAVFLFLLLSLRNHTLFCASCSLCSSCGLYTECASNWIFHTTLPYSCDNRAAHIIHLAICRYPQGMQESIVISDEKLELVHSDDHDSAGLANAGPYSKQAGNRN